ncbi:uncharacterized protein AB675_2561 [Cyphellophora attinorum]|uniref:Uncharacterized protein n=1 Tax=Cyphellophora attinorum TaxID=1664694 RepID=A0A0N1HGR7_9EURO|nr:uncharacterized protein AB675_2561 [Phialophora attinorum]KPI44890.1 hypothetical protein AB675_2561 [Phialophora attinorum]
MLGQHLLPLITWVLALCDKPSFTGAAPNNHGLILARAIVNPPDDITCTSKDYDWYWPCTVPWYEFPIRRNGQIYEGGYAGPDRVVFSSLAVGSPDTVLCGIITHSDRTSGHELCGAAPEPPAPAPTSPPPSPSPPPPPTPPPTCSTAQTPLQAATLVSALDVRVPMAPREHVIEMANVFSEELFLT